MSYSTTYAEWLWWAPVAVTNPSAQEGYQTLVVIPYVSGKMRADFGDVRFTDTADTALYHALVSKTDSDTATFRVKLPADCTEYRIFCGKADATSASSPADTYDLYDDFAGSTLDAGIWDTYSSGNGITVSNGLTVTGSAAEQRGIKSKTAFGTGYVLVASCDLPRVQNCPLGWLNAAGNRFATWVPRASGSEYTKTYTYTSESKTYTDVAGTTTKEIARNGATSVIFSINGSTKTTHTVRVPTDDCLVVYYSYQNAGVATFAWIAVRKYEATEPTTAIGAYVSNSVPSVPSDLAAEYHVLEPVPSDLAAEYHVLEPVPSDLSAGYHQLVEPALAAPYGIGAGSDLEAPYDIRRPTPSDLAAGYHQTVEPALEARYTIQIPADLEAPYDLKIAADLVAAQKTHIASELIG